MKMLNEYYYPAYEKENLKLNCLEKHLKSIKQATYNYCVRRVDRGLRHQCMQQNKTEEERK